MKNIFLGMFVFVTLLSSKVIWYDFDEAFEVAKKDSRVVMIQTYKQNCRYCVLMDKTFEDEEFAAWINKHFIATKVDVHNYKGDVELSSKLTPSFFFVDKDKKIIKSFAGSWSKEDFIDLSKNIKSE